MHACMQNLLNKGVYSECSGYIVNTNTSAKVSHGDISYGGLKVILTLLALMFWECDQLRFLMEM